jgi:hypothetical protein
MPPNLLFGFDDGKQRHGDNNHHRPHNFGASHGFPSVIVLPPKTPEAIEKRKGEGYAMKDWYFSTKSL